MKTIRIALAILALACLAAPIPGEAQSCAPFPLLVPVGSYLLTCTSCSWDQSLRYYTCSCQDQGNNSRVSTLDLSRCSGFPGVVSLANDDGGLICTGD